MRDGLEITEGRLRDAIQRLAELIEQLPDDDRLVIGALFAHAADAVAAVERGEADVSGFALGEDAELTNISLQNHLQRQQEALQTMSSLAKHYHQASMATIRRIG